MTDLAMCLALLALGSAALLWARQWHAQPAPPGALGAATKLAAGPSTRTTIALACAAGIIGANWGAARLVEGIAAVAGFTGLDAAAWAPAGADMLFTAVVAVAIADVAALGLFRWQGIAPALRHSLIGLLLPAVLAAGTPLLAQTGADAIDVVGQAPDVVACVPAGMRVDRVGDYGPEQLANAAVIVRVGKEMGVSEHGQIVAIATAMQESTLHNYDHGDRDSLGLFQQRPSQGWGSPTQVRDPVYASRAFYAHLLKVKGWESRPLWQAAQAVQRSGYPTYYAKHETAAAAVVGAVTNTTCRS